jgi:hypothetical protein
MLASVPVPQTRQRSGVGLAYMGLSALFFGLAAVFSVYCEDDLNVWQLVLIRNAVFVVRLVPWWAGHRTEARGVNRPGLFARGLAGTFMTLLYFYCFAHSPWRSEWSWSAASRADHLVSFWRAGGCNEDR